MKTAQSIFGRIYQQASSIKNFFYDCEIFKSYQVDCPVISVGNLSFGGVGKTPCVIFLAQEFQKKFKTTLICKSYKAQLHEPRKVSLDGAEPAQLFGDEACVLSQSLPQVSVWSGPHKSDTLLASLAENPELVIVDDGFSHRKIKRQFDLVLIDSTVGLTHFQREKTASLSRASAVLLTKTNQAQPSAVILLKKEIESSFAHLQGAVFFAETKTELDLPKESELFVFCGLAQPQSFVKALQLKGFKITIQKHFEDHYQYSVDDQEALLSQFNELKKNNPNLKLVTTLKDAVKIGHKKLKQEISTAAHSISMADTEKEILFEKIRKSL